MASNQLIIWLLIGCILFAFALFFSKPIKTIARIFVQGIIGSTFMFVLNFLLIPLKISVGINVLTAFIIGVLGLPGLVTLYILQVML